MNAGRSAFLSRSAREDGAGPRLRGLCSVLLFLVLLAAGCARGSELILASTTSTEDSGLFDELLPAFQASYPQYRVKLIAVGTGQALALGARGDADVLLVHAPQAEAAFMAAHGAARRAVMHNRFLLLAPEHDPARAAATSDACAALRAIAREQAAFISRGDDSGTHKKERELWQCAGIEPRGSWYLDVGQGMAETLAIAVERQGYTLSDEATYLALQPRGLVALPFAGEMLRNPYSVIVVRGARNDEGARRFAAWLTGPGRDVIGNFGRERFGRPLFTPDTAS